MNTAGTFRKRMTMLLGEYVNSPKANHRPDGELYTNAVEQGIGLLVSEGIFTARELQREAAKYDVALPAGYIDHCVARWGREV